MTVGVGERQIIIHRVLRADRVKRLCAGGAVVPGEGEHRPAVMEVNRENEVVPMDPVHHGGHLRLPVLHRELGAEVAPVRKPTVQVLVPYTSTWYCKYQKTWSGKPHNHNVAAVCLVIRIVPRPGDPAVRVEGRRQVDLHCAQQLGDLWAK